MTSLRARTLGRRRGETWNISSANAGGTKVGGGAGRGPPEEGSSRSSRTWETWWRGMNRYVGSMTSFMCCFQTYQNQEPRAHSLARLDFPRRWRMWTGMDERDSRGFRAMRGSQKGAGQSQGHRDFWVPNSRRRILESRRSKRGVRSWAGQPAQTCDRDRTVPHRHARPRSEVPCQRWPRGKEPADPCPILSA